MTSAKQEALEFLREFENSTRSYFLRKGLADSEVPAAVLEAQWQLLRNILRSKTLPRQKNCRRQQRSLVK